MSWFSFKDSKRCRKTDLSIFCNKNENSRWTVTRNEKTLALYIKLNTHQRIFNRVFRYHQKVCVMVYSCSLHKIEHSSTDLQPCLQISSKSLCHGLVLKIHSAVKTQIQESFAIKKNSRWTVKRNEKTLALYIKLNTHQRIFNNVFRCHQKICVMV